MYIVLHYIIFIALYKMLTNENAFYSQEFHYHIFSVSNSQFMVLIPSYWFLN